jgi:hypothetical protein
LPNEADRVAGHRHRLYHLRIVAIPTPGPGDLPRPQRLAWRLSPVYRYPGPERLAPMTPRRRQRSVVPPDLLESSLTGGLTCERVAVAVSILARPPSLAAASSAATQIEDAPLQRGGVRAPRRGARPSRPGHMWRRTSARGKNRHPCKATGVGLCRAMGPDGVRPAGTGTQGRRSLEYRRRAFRPAGVEVSKHRLLSRNC